MITPTYVSPAVKNYVGWFDVGALYVTLATLGEISGESTDQEITAKMKQWIIKHGLPKPFSESTGWSKTHSDLVTLKIVMPAEVVKWAVGVMKTRRSINIKEAIQNKDPAAFVAAAEMVGVTIKKGLPFLEPTTVRKVCLKLNDLLKEDLDAQYCWVKMKDINVVYDTYKRKYPEHLFYDWFNQELADASVYAEDKIDE